MKLIVTHDTALHYLRTQTGGVHRRTLTSNDWVEPLDGPVFFDVSDIPDETPLHIAIAHESQRTRTPDVAWHLLPAHTLPPRSFVPVSHDVASASPELCFVNMAARLPFATLVELGYELCGSYSRTPNEQQGFTRRAPLTSTHKLSGYLDEAPAINGVRKARRALRFVADGAASPMEAALAMMLTLPSSRGGYGFEMPQLNGEVVVPANLRENVGVPALHCDLFWPNHNVAIEYDSDQYHTGADRIARDARRRMTLLRLGVQVITVTRAQTLDMKRFDEVAELLARSMNRRLRIRARDFTWKRWELRKSLFAHDRLIP